MSVQSISKMGSLLDAVDKNMKTNLTFDDMLAITKNMAGSNLEMEKLQIEGTDKRIGGIYYYIQMKKCKRYFKKLNDHLGVTPKSVEMNNKKDWLLPIFLECICNFSVTIF